jgi:predicted transglutaminase-like cysteine proteinase
MPKNIHHRANTHTLHYKNQHQQNYKRDKKAQSDKRQIARQKVTVIHTNKQKVNVTKHTQATAIGLSLLVFNASVLSDIVLSNPKMTPGIKNNKRLSKNTQAVTKHHSAEFNDYCYQQPQASKIMPVTVVPEQKNHLTSNQSEAPKVDSNLRNHLSTSSIKKNSQQTPLNFPGVLSPPITSANYKDYFDQISYQPPLENNIVREAALFKELLKPFKHLPPLAKEKATLMTILHRLATNVIYDFDINTAGVEDYWLTTEKILARGGKRIDCEDYVTLFNFYASLGQEDSFLPQDAKFGMFTLPQHALFYYERTLPNTDNPEFYVMDTSTVENLSESLRWSSSKNYLTTLKEYTSHQAVYDTFFSKNHNNKNTDFIETTLAKDNDWSFKVSKYSPGERVILKNPRTKITTEYWKKRLNNNRRIGDSISTNDLLLLQYNYIENNGGYSIPEGIEFSADNIDYIEALEIKNILGYRENLMTLQKAVRSITANQAKYLIGSYSQNFDKFLTIHDLPEMTADQKEKLLGMYSPILKRQLTNEDVF